MATLAERNGRVELTGSRIRDRRLLIGMKQSALADAAGISPSYPQPDRAQPQEDRGKLLIELARALGVEAGGCCRTAPTATIHAHASGRRQRAGRGPSRRARDRPDRRSGGTVSGLDRADRAAAQAQSENLEAAVEALRDRLAHDPVLAEAMHEVLSSAAAIRSTADILVREADLDPRMARTFPPQPPRGGRAAFAAGERRFWGISRRPMRGARRCRPRPSRRRRRCSMPTTTISPPSRPGARPRSRPYLDQSAGMEDAASRAMAERMLTPLCRGCGAAAPVRASAHRPRGPLRSFRASVAGGRGRGAGAAPARHTPAARSPHPPSGWPSATPRGALLFRRRLMAFSIPRFGPGCPLWPPLCRAWRGPVSPTWRSCGHHPGPVSRAWSVAQPVSQTGFGSAPVMQATMLISPVEAGAGDGAGAGDKDGDRKRRGHSHRPGLQAFCPRAECMARR